MKKLWYKIQCYLTLPTVLDGILNTQERVLALEAYVKDLKWACDQLGYNPKVHGFRPDSLRDWNEVEGKCDSFKVKV